MSYLLTPGPAATQPFFFQPSVLFQQMHNPFRQCLQIDLRFCRLFLGRGVRCGRPIIRCFKRCHRLTFSGAIPKPAVDIRDLFHPALAFAMFQIHDHVTLPVEIIRDVGYLLMQAVQGVAYDPPRSARSNSYFALHSGQVRVIKLVPFSLICR